MTLRIMKLTLFWRNVSHTFVVYFSPPSFFTLQPKRSRQMVWYDEIALTNRWADCSEASPYASHNSMLSVYSFHHFLLITPIFLACKFWYWSSRDEQMTKIIRMQLEEKAWDLHGPFKLQCFSMIRCTTFLNVFRFVYFSLSFLLHCTWRGEIKVISKCQFQHSR